MVDVHGNRVINLGDAASKEDAKLLIGVIREKFSPEKLAALIDIFEDQIGQGFDTQDYEAYTEAVAVFMANAKQDGSDALVEDLEKALQLTDT